MQQGRKLFVHFRFEVFARQQSLETRTKDCYRSLQLVRSICGISGRSFQFLARGNERGFGASSVRAIHLRIHRQLLHWRRKPDRSEMTREEPTEQKQDAHAANLPAQPLLARIGIGQRVNANFVGWRKERTWIEALVK